MPREDSERRAEQGLIRFAEELHAIRKERLYPNAGQRGAWTTYCRERWGMTASSVDTLIRALPVLRRFQR